MNDLISHVLVYSILALYIGSVYVITLLLAGCSGNTCTPSWWVHGLALLIVASALLPVHRWLRISIHRLVYDWHEDPYTLISEVRQHLDLEQDHSLRAIVPTIAATIAGTLQLPYVAIATDLGANALMTAYGETPPGAEQLTIPLVYHGMPIGTLHAAARRPNEALSIGDRRLLRDLAGQVSITMQMARLNEELQASRERLVTTREEERRRIRRDLHDGFGPMLSALRLQSGALRRIIRNDPTQAEALADELRRDLQTATAEIRRLVYGLRPPLLDDLGLAGALRALDRGESGLQLTVAAPDPLPPLPAAVEVAVYRIAAEAVNNVVKHAHASHASIALDIADHVVTLTVADDGVGLAAQATTGVGLVSMRERAEELGGRVSITSRPDGGTQVVASIPWSKGVPHGEANGSDRG